MCDEHADMFADEPRYPAKALDWWNRTMRPAWAPFLRWPELSREDRSICWHLYDTDPNLR